MPITLKPKVTVGRKRPLKHLLAHLPATANSEEEAKQELTEVQRLFREQRTRAKGQKEAVTDAGHYIVVTFGDAVRARAFAQAAGWTLDVHFYADGEAVAKQMGIELPARAKLVKGRRSPVKKVPLIREG